MISYAQNYEDVILARAFAGTEEGFYVDVGAASPNEATVTRHFYEQGWHGINIEPLPAWSAELRAVRLRDLNLQVAAGSTSGEMTLYRVLEDLSLSTISEEAANRHRAKKLTVESMPIHVVTLNEVLDEVQPDRIDFLKVDVEGAEADVLGGIDLRRWRPRVILAEATEPNSIVPTYELFEPILIAGGYLYAATDGINRYYVREEEPELAPLLVPANPMDDYISMREQLMVEEISRLRMFIRHLQSNTAAPPSTTSSPAEASPKPRPRPLDLPGPHHNGFSRVSIVSSPQSGAGRLAVLLAAALGAPEAIAEHPADIAWEALPTAGVLRLVWPRTAQLKRLFDLHEFQVLTIARDPLDVLLSICRLVQIDRTTLSWLAGEWGGEGALVDVGPTSEEFASWATSARAHNLLSVSASWWADPATVRFRHEDLLANPAKELARLVEISGVSNPGLIKTLDIVVDRGVVDLEQVTGSWRRYLTRPLAETLLTHHRQAIRELGYDVDPDLSTLPDATEARRRWDELCGEASGITT